MSSDPMDTPYAEVDIRFPRLVEGVHVMQIREPQTKTTDEGVKMLVFKLETTKESLDTDGRAVYPGFKFTHRLIGVSGARDAASVAKDAAILMRAVGLPNSVSARALFDNPGQLADKLVNVKVGIDKERTGKDGRVYAESNRVAAFLPPA